MKPFKDNKTQQTKFIASTLIEKYYDQEDCGAGGSLHIVLDDYNTDKEDIEFCADWCLTKHEVVDEMGLMICKLLLTLSKEDVDDVVNNFYEIANN